MDFGAVAVGAGTTRHVELRNASGETVTASPTQLDHEGVFSALAAFRPIPPNAVARLPIEFRPRREAAHEDVFVLRTPVGNARVVLRGEGVDLRAEVTAKPPPGWPASGDDEKREGDENADTPVVDCGDCVFGAASSTSVTIRNPTRAPFTWRASFPKAFVTAPGAGGTNRAPFVVSPAGGELPPGGEAEVAVTFSPHGGAAPGAPLGAAAPPGTRGLPLSACRAILEVATTSAGRGAPPPRRASRRGGWWAGAGRMARTRSPRMSTTPRTAASTAPPRPGSPPTGAPRSRTRCGRRRMRTGEPRRRTTTRVPTTRRRKRRRSRDRSR